MQETIWLSEVGDSAIFPNFHSGNSSDNFISLYPGLIYEGKNYGYVSHYQLMKPRIIADLIGAIQARISDTLLETYDPKSAS